MMCRLWGLLVLAAMSSGAASVSLAWDASPGPDIAGYNIYHGSSGSGVYTNKTAVGNVLICTIDGLVAGRTYYFVATAVDTSGLESDYSNEVSYTVPEPEPVGPAPPGTTRAQDFRDMPLLEDEEPAPGTGGP